MTAVQGLQSLLAHLSLGQRHPLQPQPSAQTPAHAVPVHAVGEAGGADRRIGWTGCSPPFRRASSATPAVRSGSTSWPWWLTDASLCGASWRCARTDCPGASMVHASLNLGEAELVSARPQGRAAQGRAGLCVATTGDSCARNACSDRLCSACPAAASSSTACLPARTGPRTWCISGLSACPASRPEHRQRLEGICRSRSASMRCIEQRPEHKALASRGFAGAHSAKESSSGSFRLLRGRTGCCSVHRPPAGRHRRHHLPVSALTRTNPAGRVRTSRPRKCQLAKGEGFGGQPG